MVTLLLFYLTSHFISFVCSILEAVLLCSTNGYIALLKKKQPKAGELLAQLKIRIDRPLAAILTLNTAAHTIGAAGVGAQVVELYGDYWLAFASVFLTLTMLFFTEMIPKTLGALYWKRLAPWTAYVVQGLIYLSYPFVIAFESIAHLLSPSKKQEKITEEEIKLILEEGSHAGVIKAVEQDMVEGILRLGSRRVGILMTPRMEIEWLNVHHSLNALKTQVQHSSHSRFPLCDEELDEVVGLVSSKELFSQCGEDVSTDELKKLAQPPVFVPENMRVLQLLDIFKKTPDHLALVTDEYGGVQGLVTLHDLLESIIGDVPSSTSIPETQILERKDGSWLVDGMLPIDELKAYFDLENLPDEEKGAYRTLGGFCMRQIGSIPNVSDTFVWENFKFKIVKMTGKRVAKVLVHYVNS